MEQATETPNMAEPRNSTSLGSSVATGYGLKGKPRFGEPCNHCGLCCSLQLCELAEEAFEAGPPCPALFEGQCGLVRAESMLLKEPTLAKALGIGCGCSMPDDDTTDQQIIDFDTFSRRKVYGP